MAHSHPISDDDRLFVIDPTNRSITYEGDNIVLVKGDLNSEVFSFEIPRIVEGHDMSLCDHVRIHYINTDRRRKNESKDIYYVTDCVVNGDVVNFSWTLSGNATKYYGTLSFLVQFCCLDEDGTYSYIWNTDTYKSIPVYDSYNNSEGATENYADVFDKIFLQLKKMPDALSDLENDVGAVFVSDSASIGQIIKVAEVDENGNPTAWEPADLPEQVQSDWEQNDDSCADFVKNRPFYEKIDSVTLMPETQFSNLTNIYNPEIPTPADVNGEFINDFTISSDGKTIINTGDTVKVTFDGTVYECVRQLQWIGNQSLTSYEGTEDTGEPFLFSLQTIPSFHTKSTDCVVKVEADISQIKKIDSKFLELPIVPGSGTNSTIENCTTNYDYYTKNTANGKYSHAEGASNSADGECSHAEGKGNKATGFYSHAEGEGNKVTGFYSHAEGGFGEASGNYAHSEGEYTKAIGDNSHSEGKGTIAKGKYQHVQGRYNVKDRTTNGEYAHIVGNGTDDDKRSNAHTLDWNGNAWFAGKVKVGGTGQDDIAAKTLATTEDIPAVDSTLTLIGQAADAKATGDAISSLSEEIVTTSESKVAAHNTGTDTHNDIRVLIQGLTDRLNALADSDDTTLDQLSEVVAYIKSNRGLIDAITTSKVSVSDIVDNLTTNVANKPLSAAQGVALKALIDEITVPDKLPNPNALTFTGAVTGSYDGSAPLSVEIPSGGGGSGATIELDTTLTQSGHAADAKAVGDALNKVTAGAVVGRFFGKVANFLGDSQTDDAGNYKSVFFYDWLKDILGLSATNNYGYSGTTIMPIEGQTRSFLERYTSMSDDADLIVVWGGTNDYHYGHALGAVDDTENTTFCGALNNLCKGLIAKYPQKSILFVTPTPRGNIASAVATQKEYADAIIDVCAKYCIPVFDAFRKCNMPIIVDSDRRYTADGLHLNDLGHEILGKSMANFILYSEMAGAQTAWGENGGDDPDVPDPVVNVTGVTLNKNTHSLAIGETVQLAATIEPTNATNQNISWSASNGNCTVNNGLVTAVTAGDCTITATTEDGNHTASCVITVSEAVAEAPNSPVDGKTVSYAAVSSYPSGNNIVALVKVADLPDTGTTVTMRVKIADATQAITAFSSRGMQIFQDETGLLNNGAFKNPAISSYVTTVMEGDEIVGTCSLIYKKSDMTYEYAKVLVTIVPSAWPVSFKVVSMTVDLDGTYIPIQAVGGFYAVEGFSMSD